MGRSGQSAGSGPSRSSRCSDSSTYDSESPPRSTKVELSVVSGRASSSAYSATRALTPVPFGRPVAVAPSRSTVGAIAPRSSLPFACRGSAGTGSDSDPMGR